MKQSMYKRLSVRDMVYQQLEAEIGSGALQPGQAIDVRAIAAQWGVSRTPVREALVMLQANGLIEFPFRGQPRVRAFTPKQIKDTYFILAMLESTMARLGAQNLTKTDLARMKGLLAESEALVEAEEYAAFREATLRFREVLYGKCGNPRLVELVCSNLWVEVRAFGVWLLSQPGLAAARLERDCQILQACEMRDLDLVQQLVYEGVILAGERIAAHLAHQQEALAKVGA